VQTLAGKEAEGPTKEEFKDFVTDCITKLAKLKKDNNFKASQVHWSWDNPTIHGSVADGDWKGMGITDRNFMAVPTYSPDMHKVIEHIHANVCRSLQSDINALRGRATSKPLSYYINKLQGHFRAYRKKSVEADVRSLVAETLREIIVRKGDRPPAPMR
jgi:hypothetical protein